MVTSSPSMRFSGHSRPLILKTKSTAWSTAGSTSRTRPPGGVGHRAVAPPAPRGNRPPPPAAPFRGRHVQLHELVERWLGRLAASPGSGPSPLTR